MQSENKFQKKYLCHTYTNNSHPGKVSFLKLSHAGEMPGLCNLCILLLETKDNERGLGLAGQMGI